MDLDTGWLTPAFFDELDEGVLLVDGDLRCVYANRVAEQLFDRDRSLLIGACVPELVGSSSASIAAAMQEVLGKPAPTALGTLHLPAGVECDARLWPAGGRLAVLLRARHAAGEGYEALRRSEERYRALVAASAPVVWTTSPDGLVVDDSPSWRAFTGQTFDEWKGSGWLDAVHPADRTIVASRWRDAIARGTEFTTEYRLRHVSGEWRWMQVRGVPVVDTDGSIRQWVGMNADVTERRRAESAVRELYEQHRLALESADLGTWDYDLDTGVVYWDERCRSLFGVTTGEAIGYERALAIVHPDDRPHVDRAVQQALAPESDGAYHVEFRVEHPDGSIRWASARGQAYTDEARGRRQRFIGTVMDVTDQVRAHQRLRDSELRFRSLVEATAAIVWSTSPSGLFETEQPQWEAFTGQSFDAYHGMGWLDAVHPDDRARVERRWQQAVDARASYGTEYHLRRHDGTYRRMMARAVPILENDRVREWVGIHTDLTDIRQTEEALRQQTRLLETINAVNTTLANEFDQEKLVQTITDAGTELTGAQFGAFFYNMIDDQGAKYQLYTLSGVPAEAFSKFPMPRATPVFHPTFSGESIVRSDDITRDERYGRWAPHHGMPRGHLPVRSYLAVPVVSRTGEVLGGLFFGHEDPGVFTDRAEQIASGIADQAAIAIENARLFQTAQAELAERRRAEAQLLELNETLELRVRQRTAELESRNRELQEFAYVASHDLQEPLRKVHSFADLVVAEYADRLGGDGRDYLERIQAAVLRMSTLIQDLLSYSRVTTQGHPFQPIDLNEIVRETTADLQLRLTETKGTIALEPLPRIEADPVQMRQLFQNLLSNALKFHRDDAPPVVTIRGHLERDDPAGLQRCRIEIADNGIGFQEKYLDRIFVPFQRLHTRSTYQGTGIGLAICRRIVERHGGTIDARSEPGRGSTFIVTLPARPPEPSNLRPRADA